MLTEKLNKLFKEWEDNIEDHKGKFVSDGIINEVEWIKATPKILFIAKEANQYGKQAVGDFRHDWRNGISNYPFAYRIAEWSFGIISNFPVFSDIFPKSPHYHETLQKISFLNVKKTGGIGSSEGIIIGKHFDQNQKFLMKQIQIINPDIIVLSLSFNINIREKMFGDIEWRSSGYDINVARWENARLIDFYHPSSRNGPAASYSLLQNVVRSKVFRGL